VELTGLFLPPLPLPPPPPPLLVLLPPPLLLLLSGDQPAH
jgi:hypothetical protein